MDPERPDDLRENFDFQAQDWRQHPYYRMNAATECFDRVSACFDEFLETQGYHHQGSRFLCTASADKTIALFSHGGSGACVLAHLLALPFAYVITVLHYDYTSIIILEFPSRPGQYVHPRLELFNDIAHMDGRISGPAFQQRPDATDL